MGGKSSKQTCNHVYINMCGANQEQPSQCSCSSAPSFRSRRPKINGDDFESLEQVTQALQQAGLESSNLIVGIDFTKSNAWTGKESFMGRNLHDLREDCFNPYEQALSIIGRTLKMFDDDNIIPCYGFGDASTGDREVFSFHLEDRPCHGFEEVLSCYRERAAQVKLAGPTSFAPIIRNAIRLVDDSGGKYHILLIIADGQVTRSIDNLHGYLSPQEERTIDAIVEASKYPLSIVLVGVGDGPWDQMYDFDDQIIGRHFDNFQFVDFTKIMSKKSSPSKKEAEFALRCLMEIPPQYKATMSLQLLGQNRNTQRQLPFPLPRPPPTANSSFNSSPSFRRTNSNISGASGSSSSSHSVFFRHSLSSSSLSRSPLSPSPSFNRICPKCYINEKDIAFGCGDQICSDCSQDLIFCPICQSHISIRIKLRN